MDVQPVTSLIIWASLPGMTRVLLRAHNAIQGVQCLDAPWLKSVQPDANSAYGTSPSSFYPYLPAPCLRPVVCLVRYSPSKQGSFMPAKGLPQFKGRKVTGLATPM